MFNDLINKIRVEFNSKQQEIIEGIEGKIKGIVEQIDDDMSTYVVQQDDETSYLIINSEGDYSLLPPFFDFDEDAIHPEWNNLVQTIPIRIKDGIDLISLIPIDPEYQFPSYDHQSEEVIEMDERLLEMSEDFFNVYIKNTIEFTKNRTAKRLVSFQRELLSIAEENDINFQDLLQDASISNALYEYFNLYIKVSADSVLELAKDALDEAE